MNDEESKVPELPEAILAAGVATCTAHRLAKECEVATERLLAAWATYCSAVEVASAAWDAKRAANSMVSQAYLHRVGWETQASACDEAGEIRRRAMRDIEVACRQLGARDA